MTNDHQQYFALTKASPPHSLRTASLPQFALFNYFFPGLSVFTSAIHAYFGAAIDRYAPALLTVFGLTAGWSYTRHSLWRLIDQHLMSSVRIRTDDEIHAMVMMWLSKQKFSQNSRHFLANTDINSRNRLRYRLNEPDDEEEEDSGSGTSNETTTGSTRIKAFQYTPAYGSHLFWYRGYPLFFTRHQNRQEISFQTTSEREELTLSCFGRNSWILKELLLEAHQLHLKKDESKTLIYRGNLDDKCWKRCTSRLSRPFDTVILNEQVKQELLDDAADYLSPFTRRWYANRGIPYRRGYLFHGPPGTGKTSLSLALAGFFRMKIYIVSFSSAAASEENITTLFNQLPTRCIVLLEDIDSAGLTHIRHDAYAAVRSGAAPSLSPSFRTSSPMPEPIPTGSGRLSLSGLLNILDGIASQEGRILVMTTNHIEKLDAALIRPGRVDMIVSFGFADASMVASIFRAMYALYGNENELLKCQNQGTNGEGNTSVYIGDQTDAGTKAKEHVDSLVNSFVSKIPELEFTPAEIQGLLLRHKHQPEEAIDAAESWIAQMRKQKKAKEQKDAVKRWTDEEEESDSQGVGSPKR